MERPDDEERPDEAERLLAAARADADAARAEAERARDRLAFLAEVSRSVTGTLDPTEVLQRVLDLAVPRIASGGLAFLPESDGLRRVAVAHQDPEVLELGRERVLGTLDSFDGESPAATCYRTGEVQVRKGDGSVDSSRMPRFVLRLMREFGLRAAIAVPIVAGGDLLGVLSLAFNDPAALDDDDVALAVELAGRAASGLLDGALLERERAIALSLQTTVLPSVLPEVDGLDVAARYLPSEVDVLVGGDWYDAFVLPDGRLGVTVGDVGGHGLSAGATMGQLRNSLRAYAVEGYRPAEVVERLNRLLVMGGSPQFATVVYAIIDPGSGEVTWASAGHPPMLRVRRRDDEVVVAAMEAPSIGVLLGASAAATYADHPDVLGPGEALVLYTDGLVERRDQNVDDSIDALAAALASAVALDVVTPDALCDVALAAEVGTRPRADDVCVLVVARSSTA